MGVIRCKDCAYSGTDKCIIHNLLEEDDFCSRAVQKKTMAKLEIEMPAIESTGQKAILVIDMPRGCNECNCAIDLCHGTLPPEKYYNKRPDWCPLRPMPEKKEIKNIFQYRGLAEQYRKEGWNECIDLILGETE